MPATPRHHPGHLVLLHVLPALLIWLGAPRARAQVAWNPIPLVGNRTTALAYDAGRGRVVLFGGDAYDGEDDETWEWDGTRWSPRDPVNRPPRRDSHAMAYDTARGNVVLFGGLRGTTALGDTWVWNGTDWDQRSPISSPSPRGAPMAYDAASQRVLLFGGFAFGGVPNDTWAWDGTNWTQLAPSASPPRGGAMACDPVRQRIVYHVQGTYNPETWEWDGSDWNQASPGLIPPPGPLAFDASRGRVVLFEPNSGDTFEWDGSNWNALAPASRPPTRSGTAMAGDTGRGRVVLFGGRLRGARMSDTWEWDGTDWSRRADGNPSARSPNWTYDAGRDRIVMYGGDTWEWDGTDWHLGQAPGASPLPRSEPALAYDSARGRTVMFGGTVSSIQLAETWEWDGTDWTQATPATSPPAREGHTMASDEARGRIVLFGGGNSYGPLADTWEWDGTNWQQRFPATSPSPRRDHFMTYDAARGRTILVGFSERDVWEWDGTVWTQRASPIVFGEFAHGLAYDAGRRVPVLGQSLRGSPTQMWEWDGTTWTLRNPPPAPAARGGFGLVYHAGIGETVMFGGSIAFPLEDMWRYGPVNPASYTTSGSGCAGTTGTPALAVRQLPWIGDALQVEVTPTPPGQPVFFSIGLSSTTWAGLVLPVDLGVIQAPGCLVNASIDLSFPGTSSPGGATWTLPLCNCPTLLGSYFFQQAFVVDPLANPLGLVTSNAAQATIGSK